MLNSHDSAIELFLKRLLLRSRLSIDEQEAILALKGHAIQVDGRRDVVRPGDKVDHACLVVRGLAARFDQMADGQRQITAFYIAGDMCDLHSVPVAVAGWGIEALATTTIVKVPHSELLAIATRHPAIAFAFWRDTTADASILAKSVSNLGRRNAQARLAHLICEMGIRMEQTGLGTRTEFAFQAIQAQLAEALGMTDVHMNRSIQGLRREGLLRTENRIYYVEDWDRLASIAEFSSDYLLIPELKMQSTPKFLPIQPERPPPAERPRNLASA